MSYDSEVTADSPLGRWKLDETTGTAAADVGSGNHAGLYAGSPTLGATGIISVGTAVALAKAGSQRIDTPNLGFPASGDFTLGFWMKWPSGTANDIIGRDQTSLAGAGFIPGYDVSGTFGVRIASTNLNTSVATSAVRDNQPHYVALTRASTTGKVYVDGNLVASGTVGTGSITGAISWGRNGANTPYTDITLDDIATYSTALSQARIQAHYAAGAAPPAPPANTSAPAITTDGTPATGETISVSSGTWTGSPTFSYQWKREGTNISGATSNTYVLQSADEGHNIKCTVTGTNAGGSAAADSNTIVPAVSTPISSDDIALKLSGGSSNTLPVASLGGAESTTSAAGDLFDTVQYSSGIAGQIDYRLIYVHNTHPVFSAQLKAYIALQEPAGQEIAVAVASQAAGVLVTAIGSKTTTPSGVTFTAPVDAGTGVDLGIVPPASFRGLWVRRTVDPLTPGSTSNPAQIAIDVAQV